MARIKRRVRNRGRKSKKRKPVRTRRRCRGCAKGRRTKRWTKNMKGGDTRACPECGKKKFHVPADQTLYDNPSYLAHKCGNRAGATRCGYTVDADERLEFCELYDDLQKKRYELG